MQSINSIAQNLLNKYDKNYNGSIELNSYYNEGSKYVRTVSTGYSQDIVTVTRYSQAELFRKADRNYDGNVTRSELERYVAKYDRDHDGFLDDYDPWANQYDSERERFNKENRETSYVVSRDVINHFPTYPNYPHQPHYPHYPYPSHPQHPHHPHHPQHPHHPHNRKNDNDWEIKFKIRL